MAKVNTLNRNTVRLFVTEARGRHSDAIERAAEEQLGLIHPVVTRRGILARIGNNMLVELTPRGHGHAKLLSWVGKKTFQHRGNASYNVRTIR
jgi:hypothetical protein